MQQARSVQIPQGKTNLNMKIRRNEKKWYFKRHIPTNPLRR